MTEAEIAQLSPDVRQGLDETIPGWRGLSPDQVQEGLTAFRKRLMAEADKLLDLYNDLGR